MRRVSKLDRFVTLQAFAESTNGGDPTVGAWATITSMWAEKMDKGRAENFISASEIAEADAAFRVRWYDGIEPTWRLVDGTDAWDIRGVVEVEKTRRRDEMLIVVNRYVPGDSVGVVTPVEPADPVTPTTIDVRVVWSVDRVITSAELATGEPFTSNTFAIPAHVGFAYLVIWRADANGGAPSGLMFDGQPQRGAFDDDGTALTASDGVDGEYIVSLVQLDGTDIGGDEMELTG